MVGAHRRHPQAEGDDGEHARHGKHAVPDQVGCKGSYKRQHDLRIRFVVHVAQPQSAEKPCQQPHRHAAQPQPQKGDDGGGGRGGGASRDKGAQHEEKDVGGAVVEEGFEIDQGAQPLGQAGCFQHGHYSHRVRSRKHGAKQGALGPGPAVRKRKLDERSGRGGADEDAGPGQQQGGRQLAAHGVPLEGGRAGVEEGGEEAS